MPSPPVMLLCAAGIGLAALLYYYFTSREERDEAMAHGYAATSEGSSRPRRRRRVSRCELEECSICQEIVYRPSALRTLVCGHHFHVRCIEKWLEAAPAPKTCPNCRQVVQNW